MKISRRGAAAIAVALLSACAPTFAQTYPSKPIRLVLPTAPGTAPDTIARIMGDKLSRATGQPVIVENKPGAGGIIAMNLLKAAPADGYTLALVHAAVATVTPLTYKEAQYDIERDYETVALVGVTPMIFVANPKFEAKTLADAIRAARAAPDSVAAGSPNRTSIPHLANELLAIKTGIRLQQVPFATTGQGVQAVVAGDIAMYTDGVAPLIQLIKSGRLRALAVASDKVLPGLEGIPLAKETVPDLKVMGWFMIAAPKGTPAPLVERLNQELNRALQMPDVSSKFQEFGTYPTPASVAEARRFVKNEKALFGGIVNAIGVKPE